MQQVGIWHVTEDGPKKAPVSGIDLEERLEEWIENDPALLETGLTIVGRQIMIEAGTLDLLAIDPQGTWTVIELKRGTVHRDTIAQALDYASCIAKMPYDQLAAKVNHYLAKRGGKGPRTLDEALTGPAGTADVQSDPRSVKTFVVGTGRNPGLERLVSYLSDVCDVPISVVSYQVFEIASGQRVLVRELADSEPPGETTTPRRATIEELTDRADKAGVGPQFRMIFEAATRHGLPARIHKNSVTFTSTVNHIRSLITIGSDWGKRGKLATWVGTDVFALFFPVTEEEATSDIGPNGWRQMSVKEAQDFVSGLDRLFERMAKAERS